MDYPYNGLGKGDYTSEEIKQLYRNGEISKDEARNLADNESDRNEVSKYTNKDK
jgi:hypothetical protein